MRKAAKSIAGCLYLEFGESLLCSGGIDKFTAAFMLKKDRRVIPVLYVVCRAIDFLVSKQQPKQKFW